MGCGIRPMRQPFVVAHLVGEKAFVEDLGVVVFPLIVVVRKE